MPRLRAGIALRIATVLVLVAGAGAVSMAQRFGVIEGAGAGIRVPPRDFNDGGFTVCKWMFRSDRSEPSGVGWSTDYPFGEINLLIRLSELTKIRVSRDRRGDVNYWVVRATDDQLFNCPILIGSDVGTAALSNAEVQRLREYLLKGGFLWVDDFWGEQAWAQWTRELSKALPDAEYTIEDVPLSDPIFRSMIEVKRVPQVTGIGFWRAYRGRTTSERGEETAVPHLRAVRDRHGRIIVVMTHNTDVSNAFERETEDPAYFYQFSVDGYALGINILLYAMTH